MIVVMNDLQNMENPRETIQRTNESYPEAENVWNIYLHRNPINDPNVGKYTIPYMEHLG